MLDSIGCTANMILLDDKHIYVANAGDSRCVLGRGGKAFPLSFDHKPENPIEKKRIELAGSVITEGRVDGNLNLSRAIGDLKYKVKKELKPEEFPVTANPDTFKVDRQDDDDFIIMGCDGIWEKKENSEMVEFIYERLNKGVTDLKEIVSDVLEDCISPDYTQTNGIGCDNMTCIII
jgi:protein phosphatase 1G